MTRDCTRQPAALLVALLLVTLPAAPSARPQSTPPARPAWGVRFADTVIATWPDPAAIDPAQNGWEYNTGIVLFGMSKMYDATRDPRYLAYIKRWVDGYRSVKLDLLPFTLVGATTRAGILTNPLRDRFGIVARLEFYTPEELVHIVERSSRLLEVEIVHEGAFEIARRARGTPRVANRLLRRVRDYAEVKAQGRISREVADAALTMLEVYQQGLDVMDRKLLGAVIEKFGGGPVGVENLAHAIGEEADTIEDVLEPYLIQQGFLQRTPRGRMATLTAYRHFGIVAPSGAPDLLGS